ncbi:hypothetical protein QBC32DRAFT_237187 [Pseudoneurospora amorphoporcata]|uniref:Uncharacterized protein n=1 Tax=Pseudoneurospora amorphoporcata TaxID=241081 RepID=A0AAN6SG72_9PEZI|nr:hypothetical protein QBC32DRAFT_237187 [Pseudoneurospora amorphoporcata]
MARYESLHGNHDDDEEQDQGCHVIDNEDEEEMDERRHTGSSASSKSSYTAVEQDDEEGGAGRRAVYAALYGGGGSPPSGDPAPASSDQHFPGTGTGADHHHPNNIHPVLQNPGPYTDAPLIPPRSPARSTSNNPFFNGPTSTTSTTSSPQQATATDHQPQRQSSRSSRSRFRSGSIASGEPRKSRSTSRDSTNYVNQYSRSWKPSYGLPHSRDHHHHHPGQSPFPPLPETAEDHHHLGEDHDYRDHDHDSSDDHRDLDQDDYMYEKESGMSTWRGRGTTGSVKEKGGKGGMRKLMLVERTDTVKRGKGAGTGRGRRETVMSEVSTDAADSISVRGLPMNGGGGGSGWQGISTTTIAAGGSGGGLNRGEQHLSYFHFESTDTLVQIIGLVLSIYDHKPPPTWPGALNLNVFLSFMTTLATACYMIPVIEGLGQLRWLRYTGGRRGNVSRPASDFEAIDQASRGVHHCWKLLGFQGGPLGLLATLITFLTLFTPCITQLVITYTPPQPHRNNPGEPFDSNRASITLVKINWSWLFFLLVQVLLSAVFLTAIIVQTRMEGMQIFKSSALPGMTALDGQARMQLGGGGLTGVGQGGNGGIMTNAVLGQRAKKTNLKLERSAGGGNHGYGLVQGFVVDLNSSSGSSGSTSMGSSGSGSASAGTGLHLPKGLGLGIGWERFRHRDHDALPSYEKEGGFRGGNYEEGGGGGSVGGGRHQAFGNGPAENLNFPAAAAAAAGFTPLPTSMAMPMQIATTVPASTALPGRRKMMRLSMFGGGGGGGAGRKKLRVRGLPVHAS